MPWLPAFETNEATDCGEGIHLMGVDHSFVIRNISENNSGGILVTNETGPSWSNLISGNVIHDNGYACGITLASHGPATSLIPTAGLPYPISHNTISKNESHHNGLLLPGAGAGVGIFAPFPGTTTTANVVSGNSLHDNGLPGVTMHNHAWSPFAPPVNLNDNVIIGNKIWGNAADTADAHTPGTTGIDLYSVAPVTGTIIAQNEFSGESLDIVFSAPAGSTMFAHFNDFNSANIGIDNLGAGTIDASNNWWNQASGPGAGGSTAAGAGVATAPWLPVAYGTYADPQ